MPVLGIKLNTADFELHLGGNYELESGGYYDLEDGSGVLELDCYVPQLGDPVVFTNPAWSGRVTSVATSDYFDKRTNYVHCQVVATNQSAAPGGTAPGDLIDGIVYYQLEDLTGYYDLESSGSYEIEGNLYRALSVRQSSNQDGSTTTYGSLQTYVTGYAAGQSFALWSQNQGYNGKSFTITNVIINFIGANPPTPLYTIEFGDKYQTLQSAGGGVLTQVGSQASIQQGSAVPAGTLGSAQVTSNQTPITTAVDLTGLSVTVTVATGRRLRITGYAQFSSTLTTGQAQLAIFADGAQVQLAGRDLSIADNSEVMAMVPLQPTAGVHTYKLQGAVTTGTGTMVASATAPAFILVEDIGI